MSEREFLELLNLYLDREITAPDADRLEREIRTNPVRHRTYLQYCRMQQAVRRLGATERFHAQDRSTDVRVPERSKSREYWGSRWVWTGAVAAAAVLVLVVAARRSESAKSTPEELLAADSVRRDPGSARQQPELGLSGDALLLSTFPVSGSGPKVQEDKFNWMRQFQLVSLESRTGAQPLSPSAIAPQPVATPASKSASGDDATEMAAFKFVK